MKHEGPYDSSASRADIQVDSKAVKSVKLKEKMLNENVSTKSLMSMNMRHM